ncbi:O-linked N-acetylglucosamine transferase family protein [Azospirillum picis]|uniref:protein O-GlcNAc transferase n=2 Tax=Azospirillum picis TaxID=488438 RepID=A0ABU0MP08_9PROT|nr:tetratricopeptide repeat protein [Azospirillum picis]MBP2303546.1 putative O-linked N-acetylglucosamine transferase (SPINDLY family) [Azospirillum picis]MDQ0534948.1 putative O-linked N-acetylglucosamine transferase (SPINDLY family) [Azospirillum picis]
MSVERAKTLASEGLRLAQQGRMREAVPLLRGAAGLAPWIADLHLNLGIALLHDGVLPDAEDAMRRTLALACDQPAVHKNLGMLHLAGGRPAEAAKALRRALALAPWTPDRGALLNNIGVALRPLGRLEEAAEHFRHALRAAPGLVDARKNLAMTLVDLLRTDEALAVLRTGLALAPDAAELHGEAAHACKERGMVEEAAVWLERARQLNPAAIEALHSQLLLAHYQPGVTAAGLHRLHADMERWHGRRSRAAWKPHGNGRDRHRPLRVGYVSGDLRRHPVGFFLAGMMRHHDPAQVIPFLYSCHPHQDAVTAAIRAGGAIWRQVHAASDEELAEQIRTDGIDILVDLAGHTAHNRLRVFARRPAPVQASWAGYVGTTGLEGMDWLVADRFHVPPGEDGLYTERVARMPHGYVCWQPPDDAPPVAPPPALARGFATFGCFNNIAKVTPPVVALWADILRRVPTARLVMRTKALGDAGTRRRYLALFAAGGIAAERLTLGGELPQRELLAAYGDVDVALDPFPYSGGVTTLEALWMGVPVITMPGRSFAGRHSTSHLSNIGHAGWVAADPADYVARAVAWAEAPDALAAIRRGLRQDMAASPLLDHRGFARDLEALWRELWHDHLERTGEPSAPPLQPAVHGFAAPGVLHRLGVEAMRAGDAARAVRCLTAAVALAPAAADALDHLGVALSGRGSFEPSIRALRHATAVAPGDPAHLNNLVQALIRAGRFTEAAEALTRACAAAPFQPSLVGLLGDVRARLGDAAGAEAAYLEIAALRPEAVEPWLAISRLCRHTGRTARALGSLVQALQRRPDDADLHAEMAAIFADLDDPGRAVAAAKRALALEPGRVDRYRDLALVFHRQQVGTDAASLPRRIASLQ